MLTSGAATATTAAVIALTPLAAVVAYALAMDLDVRKRWVVNRLPLVPWKYQLTDYIDTQQTARNEFAFPEY